jgi:hypothetical protein
MPVTAQDHLDAAERLIADAYDNWDLEAVQRSALLVQMHLGAGQLILAMSQADRAQRAQLDMKSVMSSMTDQVGRMLPGSDEL